MSKIKIVLAILVISTILGIALHWHSRGVVAGLSNAPVDVLGTRIGTSTTGVGFYGKYAATSSNVVFISHDVDLAVFNLKSLGASSTPSGGVQLSILASSDAQCYTATTSPDVGNPILVDDINWYDAASHILNLAGSTSIAAGTTTITWNPKANQGKEIILTELNAQCLKFDVNASSTVLYGQIKTKEKR